MTRYRIVCANGNNGNISTDRVHLEEACRLLNTTTPGDPGGWFACAPHRVEEVPDGE